VVAVGACRRGHARRRPPARARGEAKSPSSFVVVVVVVVGLRSRPEL
jgi:hypothetical protein